MVQVMTQNIESKKKNMVQVLPIAGGSVGSQPQLQFTSVAQNLKKGFKFF